MSYYCAIAGIVKIRDELQEDFGYLYNEEYDKIRNSRINEFAVEYFSGQETVRDVTPIRYWKHNDIKEEWRGKYETSYADGIFTYGCLYNDRGVVSWFMLDFRCLLNYLTEYKIESDCWNEPV